ncbi:MAG: MaoC family dehydratase [Psychromonas sp.]|nr:MaoC family dehydratase [Psychromonas sp.]
MKIIDFDKYKKEWKNWDFKMWMSPSVRDYYSIVLDRAHSNTKQLVAWVKEYSILKDGKQVNIGQKEIKVLPAAASLFEELQSKIGEEVHVGEWMEITQTLINEFAQVTDDHQWLHTDVVRSEKDSPFKTTIAHGFLTLSLLPKLTESVSPDKSAYPYAKMTVNYGLNKVRFPYPVKAGSTIRAHSRLIKVTPLKRGLQIEKEISVEIKNTRRPACVAESIVRIYF